MHFFYRYKKLSGLIGLCLIIIIFILNSSTSHQKTALPMMEENKVMAVQKSSERLSDQATSRENPEIETWLEKSGINESTGIDDALTGNDSEKAKTFTPFIKLKLNTLKELAEQGNLHAAHYYALLPNVPIADSIKHLENVIVQKNYSYAAFELAQQIESEQYRKDLKFIPIGERLQSQRNNGSIQLSEADIDYLGWINVGVKLGDAFAQDHFDSDIRPYLTSEHQAVIHRKVQDIISELNLKRNQQRLPLFQESAISNEVKAYTQNRLLQEDDVAGNVKNTVNPFKR